VRIDAFRRNLQRAYLDLLNDKLNGRTPVTDDQRPFIRGELKALNADLARAVVRTTDRAVRLHLEDARDMISKILDPKFTVPAASPAGGGLIPVRGLVEDSAHDHPWSQFCWTERALPTDNR